MKYVWQKFKEEIANFLVECGVKSDKIILEIPPDEVRGELAFPCFGVAKDFGMKPNEVAVNIVNKKHKGILCADVLAMGPYVNFLINKPEFFKEFDTEVGLCEQCYGSGDKKEIKLGVEYLSPNTNKPLTIGHARNASIGKSLVEILRFAGFEVVSIVLYNDRGVHICKSMLAFQKWGEDKTPEEVGVKSDHWVGNFYQKYGIEVQKNEKLEEEVQEMLVKWEKGDEEVRTLWKKMNGWFFDGEKKTLKRVGIDFDREYLESEIYKFGREIVDRAVKEKKANLLKDGAVEVDLTEVGLDKKILLRRDGTTVYIVQDLYLAKKKIDDLKLDKSIYVVANEQIYHFEVLFELLDRFGIADKSKMYHLAYAMVNAASGKKMSSRQGTGDSWDGMLDELKILAEEEIVKRDEKIEKRLLDQRAEVIGQSALKYVLLNQDINKNINFKKEDVVRFEGETGPYLLYTYARVYSILEKNKYHTDKISIREYENEEMKDVLVYCAMFGEVVHRAAENYDPSILCRYTYVLCRKINNFYHKHRVLDADSEDKVKSRIKMLILARTILGNSLNLLGIDVLSAM